MVATENKPSFASWAKTEWKRRKEQESTSKAEAVTSAASADNEKQPVKAQGNTAASSRVIPTFAQYVARRRANASTFREYVARQRKEEGTVQASPSTTAVMDHGMPLSDAIPPTRLPIVSSAINGGTSFDDLPADEIATKGVMGWQKYLSDQTEAVERAKAAKEEKTWWEKAIPYILAIDTHDRGIPGTAINNAIQAYSNDDSYMRPTDKWGEQERHTFGYLYADSPASAYRYAEQVNDLISKGEREEKQKKIAEAATESKAAAVLHTAGAVLTAPLAIVDYLNDMAEQAGRGRITERSYVTPYDYSKTAVKAVADDLNEKSGTLDESIPLIGGKGAGDLYQLGTDIVESTLSVLTMGPTFTAATAFGRTAADGVQEARARGAEDGEALLYGTAIGVADAVAEKIGLDRLIGSGTASGFREAVASILKQAGVEGLEEGITSVLTEAADRIVLGENSRFSTSMAQYEAEGASSTEARKQAWLDTVREVSLDVLGGAVTGAIHATTKVAADSLAQSARKKRLSRAEAEDWTPMYHTVDNDPHAMSRLTIPEDSDILESTDIKIGQSVGASHKNYPVRLSDSRQRAKLAPNQKLEGKVFAGKGTDVEIRDRFRLEADYKIPASEWKKVSGDGYIILNGQRTKVELHWYAAEGEVVEIKMKRRRDENKGNKHEN